MDIFMNELYHYGVIGMKWGVRRYQNKDGTLTSKGKQRYNTNKNGPFQKQKEKYVKAGINVGMSKEEAERAADKQIKVDKILMISAGVTLAAVAGYAGYKYYKYTRGINIPVGEALQRISPRDTLHDRFYVSFGKHDNARYAGVYQNHVLKNHGLNENYKTVFEAVKDIKAPNRNQALDVFSEYAKNDKNASNILAKSVIKKIKDGTISKRELNKAYESFNKALPIHNQGANVDGFYNLLKSKGFNSIVDINDLKYSGYMAKAPLVIFDKSSVKVNYITKQAYDKRLYGKEYTKLLLENIGDKIVLGKVGGATAATVGAVTVSKYILKDEEDDKNAN